MIPERSLERPVKVPGANCCAAPSPRPGALSPDIANVDLWARADVDKFERA